MLIYEHFLEIERLFGCVKGSTCKVGLHTFHDKFVVVEDNGQVNAYQDELDVWEIFTVRFIGENKVQFKGYNGKYLVAEEDGTVNANRDQPGVLETWEVEDKVQGLAFKSYHGRYMVAESNGELNANREVYENDDLASLFFRTTQIFRVAHPNGNIYFFFFRNNFLLTVKLLENSKVALVVK